MKPVTKEQFAEMPPEARIALLVRIETDRIRRNKIDTYYPATGPLRRELYPKHLAFFEAGQRYRERAAMAANRVGKTEGMGCYELACHLMGDYPAWWPGRVWKRPVNWMAAGKTNELTRDIIQAKLFGKVKHLSDGTRTFEGTGLIRGDSIGRVTWKSGVTDLADSILIKTKSGGMSMLVLRSYEQGRKAFEGTERDGILLDEEPPFDIWTECVIRTATTNGIVIGTFTPLDGITDTVMHFLPGELMSRLQEDLAGDAAPSVARSGVVEVAPSRCMVMVGWDDVPHLSEQTKRELLDATPVYQHKARRFGIPSLGDGAVFPIDEEKIKIDPIRIPDHWVRICGLDFGWDHPTAAMWLAYDRETDTIYVIDEYGASRTVIPMHASAINARGKWIPVAWPHDGYQVKDQTNGEQLAQQYRNEGCNMRPLHAQFQPTPGSQEKTSVVSVEAGLQEMLTRMQTGRWKVFSTCVKWFEEFRIYRRENGKLVKLFDDRISASRYAMMDLRYAVPRPSEQRAEESGGGWSSNWRLNM
jgi:phage terminase large subunit-like protein